MEELVRLPLRRYQYGGAEIVLWVGMYQEGPTLSPATVVRGLFATVDGVDVPIALNRADGEAELLAKVRQWIDARPGSPRLH